MTKREAKYQARQSLDRARDADNRNDQKGYNEALKQAWKFDKIAESSVKN